MCPDILREIYLWELINYVVQKKWCLEDEAFPAGN